MTEPVASRSNNLPAVPLWVWFGPRGKAVQMYRYLPAPPPESYFVVCFHENQACVATPLVAYDVAEYLFLEETILPGADGVDCSWNAVLTRLTGRVEPPGQWLGSPASILAAGYPVGSWRWIDGLRKMRLIREGGGGAVSGQT